MNQRHVVLAVMGAAMALVGGCAQREAERYEVVGMVRPVSEAGIPPAGQTIIRLAADRGASDGMPVDRDGAIIILADRREWFLRTGRDVPPPLPESMERWNVGRDRERILGEAANGAADASASLDDLIAVLGVVSAAAGRGQDAAPYDDPDLQEAIGRVIDASKTFLAENTKRIPGDVVPAHHAEKLLGEAWRRWEDLTREAEAFHDNGVWSAWDRGGPEQPWRIDDGAPNASLRAWESVFDARRRACLAAFRERNIVRVVATSTALRDHVRALSAYEAWRMLQDGSKTVIWNHAPSDADLSFGREQLRRCTAASDALVVASLGALLRLSADQPTPVLVYAEPWRFGDHPRHPPIVAAPGAAPGAAKP